MKKILLIPFLLASIAACEGASDVEDAPLELHSLEQLGIDSPCPFDSSEFSQCMDEAEDDGYESFRSYSYLEVIDACEGAYSSGSQIQQCITNVCGHYGCG